MKIEEKFGYIKLFVNRDSEKDIVLNKIKEIFSNKFSQEEHIILYLSNNGKETKEDIYFHKNVLSIENFIFSELSTLYDNYYFDSIDVNCGKEEFQVTFWVPCGSAAHNGHSIYLRHCSEREYVSVKNEILNSDFSDVVKKCYLNYLERSHFVPSFDLIKNMAIRKLNNFFLDVITNIEPDINEYETLKENDIISLIEKEINSFTDNEKVEYSMFKEFIKYNYYSENVLKIYLGEIVLATYTRSVRTEYFFDFE